MAEPYEADRHELQLHRDRQRPGEVGHEHDRALEHADQHQVRPHAAGQVVVGHLLGQLGDLLTDLLLGDEHGGHVALVHATPLTTRPFLPALEYQQLSNQSGHDLASST